MVKLRDLKDLSIIRIEGKFDFEKREIYHFVIHLCSYQKYNEIPKLLRFCLYPGQKLKLLWNVIY